MRHFINMGLAGAAAILLFGALPAAAQSAKAALKSADGKDVGAAELTADAGGRAGQDRGQGTARR